MMLLLVGSIVQGPSGVQPSTLKIALARHRRCAKLRKPHSLSGLEMESAYRILNKETKIVEGQTFLVLGTPVLREGTINREHTRTIVADKFSALYNRPVVYSDNLSGIRDEKQCVYARHDFNQEGFFDALDRFLSERSGDFREVIRKGFHCVVNIAGEFFETEVRTSFVKHFAGQHDQVSFLRLYAPFGDMSVDFDGTPTVQKRELRLIESNCLPKALEFPLCAFDASISDIWASLLVSVHWASGSLAPTVLSTLIQDAALMRVS